MSEQGPGPPPSPPAPSLPGLQLEARVAEGPFSEVWHARRVRARDAEGAGDDAVAVKLARGVTGARMLAEEAALAARLRRLEGRVVPVLEFHPGEDVGGEGAYLVMPWIGSGATLRDSVSDAESDPDQRALALKRLARLIEIVSDVHQHGVVHGDLKPENVLLTSRSAPVLADFGLARVRRELRLEGSLSQSLRSEDGLTGGTLAYMAPEVQKGGEPSYQADVYALGVMLHEVLLGRRPDKAARLEDLGHLLPEPVVEVLRRSLAYAPADRYPDARTLGAAAHEVLQPLQQTGWGGRLARAGRVLLVGLAAFFVALRYVGVVGLLAGYALLGAAFVESVMEGEPSPVPFVALVALLGVLQLLIGWKGFPDEEQEPAKPASPVWRRGLGS